MNYYPALLFESYAWVPFTSILDTMLMLILFMILDVLKIHLNNIMVLQRH